MNWVSDPSRFLIFNLFSYLYQQTKWIITVKFQQRGGDNWRFKTIKLEIQYSSKRFRYPKFFMKMGKKILWLDYFLRWSETGGANLLFKENYELRLTPLLYLWDRRQCLFIISFLTLSFQNSFLVINVSIRIFLVRFNDLRSIYLNRGFLFHHSKLNWIAERVSSQRTNWNAQLFSNPLSLEESFECY